MIRTAGVVTILVLGSMLAACSGSRSPPLATPSADSTGASALVFNERGEATIPAGYRSWVHVGSTWVPIGVTILDGTTTRTPEILNVYVEPHTYRAYMTTGTWPQGSLIVKEFTTTSVDKSCDGPPAYVCRRWYGMAIFQTGYTGIGVMLKDSKRFPSEPGHWAFFSYGHQSQPYAELSPPRSREQCAQCHIDHVGPVADYVFSAMHIGLDRSGSAAHNSLSASLPD